MAAIVILRNPLDPSSREVHPRQPGERVIDWLQEHHPNGFGMPVKFYVNGEEKPLDDLDYALQQDDIAVIALMPGDPVTLTTIAIGFLISAALSVVTYFVMQAFLPKEVKQKGKSVTAFEVSSDQNAARLGEAIPVIYGKVLTSPDYITQPYTWFDWSLSSLTSERYNGVQYLDVVMCVGQGDIDIIDVFAGESSAKTFPAGVLQWRAFKPADHQKQMGVISTAMGSGFHENVVTSTEVSNQEFLGPGDAAGFYSCCKPGQKGDKIQIDITFPGGQTNPDSDGDLKGRITEFNAYYMELDDNDNLIGTTYSTKITATSQPSTSHTNASLGTSTSSSSGTKNRAEIASPLRRSYMITAPKSARWAVKLERITAQPSSNNGTDRFLWTGLKLYLDHTTTPVYGDVTLLAVRVKASQGLGADAAVRIYCRAQRLLAPVGGGVQAPTRNSADAFADIMTDTVYGANRPVSEVDTATLTALRTKWNAYPFDHVFRDRSTVWEALRSVTIPYAAEPLPLGGLMSVAEDGVKPIRSAMFTDANIVADTMTISYGFDEEGAPDGVEIEYIAELDWRSAYVKYPATSVLPEKFQLEGVVSAAHAEEYARLTWNRKQLQRKRVTFDTELEGLIVQMGDRIGIQHNVPKWGEGGQVVRSISANRIDVDHDLDWSGAGQKYIMFKRRDGSVTDPIPASAGFQPHEVVLGAALPFTPEVDTEYDFTTFAFGEQNRMVRDFTVTMVRPNGENTVTIEAVCYDETVFDGAMAFLR
ncbi:MAG: host specificity factor TipJ family phage tail protein [Pseudomonadales bacterium]